MDKKCRGELIEMRSKMWIAVALCSALTNLAMTAPEPLSHRMEELSRAVEAEISKAIAEADSALASSSASDPVAA